MICKFLDPKNDIAFKKIFGTEQNKDILLHFLNDMLKFKGKSPIVEITFLSPVQNPEIAVLKTSYVDVLCKDEHGNKYIVEMQVAKEDSFLKRAQYYASKAYSSQTHVGEEFEHLKEVIFLAIADFVLFPDKKDFKSDHVILDRDTHEHDLQDFSFTFVELPKFKKDDIAQLSNMIDKWCYFFKYAEDMSPEDLKKLMKSDKIIKRAYEELDRHHWTEEEMLSYEWAEKQRRIYTGTIKTSFRDGKAEGKAEGIVDGKVEVVKKMLARGLDIKMVMEMTDLSQTEIQKIK